jgi:hypothetical protein
MLLAMNFGTTLRELGLRDGSLYLLGRFLSLVSRGRVRITKYYLTAQPIGSGQSTKLRPDPGTTFRDVLPGDDLIAAFPARPADTLLRRFGTGATCTAAVVKGQFAGFIWLQREAYEEDEVRCTYVLVRPEASVWDFDVHIEPRYRLGRTMARLWAHVDERLGSSGVRWSFSRISAFNVASLSSHARLGARRCGAVSFLTLGPWQLAWGACGWHWSTSSRLVPRVLLMPPQAA